MNGKVATNVVWIVGCRIFQSFLALLIGMISARYLGPNNYGLLNYAISVVSFVVPLAQLGLRNILVEEIISHPEREGQTIGTSLVLSIVSSLLCICGCIAFVSIVNAGETETLIVCALYCISLIFQMTEMIQYWYQAKLLSKYTALTSLVAYIVVSLYRIFLLITEKSIYWFAISYTFEFSIISVILLVIYGKLGGQKLSFSFTIGKQLLSRSRHYIVSSIMVALITQTDKIMIKKMLGNIENGYYSTAVVCAGITGFVFAAIIDSFRPIIFESKKISKKKYEDNIVLLYSIIIYMGLLQSLLLSILATPIVKIMYGEEYLNAIPILRTITWYSSFAYMGSVRNIWMLAENKHKYMWIINLSGASLNIVCNYLFISSFGVIGAAISSVLTQLFTNFILCILIKPIKPITKLILKSFNPNVLLRLLRRLIDRMRCYG